MKWFTGTFTYEYAWADVTMAHWNKYPNPWARHVLAGDVWDRRVMDGILFTTRVFLKTGSPPKWGRSLLKSPQSYVIEESQVDPITRTLVTKTRNLSYRGIMVVEETQTFRPHPEDNSKTLVTTEARIVSNFGWGLTSRIENFGLKRFGDNSDRSRQGMGWVLEKLREKRKQYGYRIREGLWHAFHTERPSATHT